MKYALFIPITGWFLALYLIAKGELSEFENPKLYWACSIYHLVVSTGVVLAVINELAKCI